MKNTLLVLGMLSLGAIFVIAQTSASKAISDFDRQLIDQERQFLQTFQSKNLAAVERAISDDFRGIGNNGDLYDKSEILDATQEGASKEERAYDFHVVRLTDASAVVTYNLIVPGDRPRYRHMADTWAKVDGRWRLKFRQITPNLWSANDSD